MARAVVSHMRRDSMTPRQLHSRLRGVMAGIALLGVIACAGDRVPRRVDSSAASVSSPPPAESSTHATRPGRATTLPHASPAAFGEYRLAGNEPLWSVRVSATGLTYTTPDYAGGIEFRSAAPQVVGTTLRWVAITPAPDAHTIEVIVDASPCQDSMADKRWTHTATVVFDGTRHSGCAERTNG